MKRRNFIKLGATASALALMPFEVKSMLKSAQEAAGCDFSKRRLVLINLDGGNDGLNTVIPVNQYDIYSNLRPTIKVPDSGVDAFITLDSTLPADQQVGLHPTMTEFKSLYDEGKLRLLQSVGYPSQNKSHFASTDLWMTGNDGNGMKNGKNSGLLGRFMEQHYSSELSEKYPLAIQIGSIKNSLGFHGVEEHGMSMNLTNQDPSGFYSVINGLGGEPPATFPNSDFGTELKYIVETDKLANIYAESVSSTFNNGSNVETYPDTDISDQLKTVARLIKGGLDTKLYMVRLKGYDTHNNQVEEGESIVGRHSVLMEQLSEAVGAFCKDLEGLGIADDVVGMTYSEFGRKAKENGSFGTDHGEIAPMFVFGKGVEGGVSGTNPDLSEATDDNNYQIQTVQYDYRQVFATLLQQYMGAGNETIDGSFFNHTDEKSFSGAHVNEIIREPFKINADCQTSVVTKVEDNEELSWVLSPNPCVTKTTLRCDEDVTNVNIELITSSGRSAISEDRSMSNGKIELDLSQLKSGVYVLKVNTPELGRQTLKLIKK